MTSRHTSFNTNDDAELAALQQALIERPDQAELLQTYFNRAIAVGQVQQARLFLGHLQELHPWNHLIRRWVIALSLQKKDYPAAVDAVETLMAFSAADDALIDAALKIRANMGPRSIVHQAITETSISLCMIVKNEQAFLCPCLNSIKHLVDEMIVVDTGSEDRSADIARVYGAEVFRETWRDDFALMRNISLEKASGDWILILDADETIAPQDFDTIRQLVQSENEKASAYAFQTRNYLNLANVMDWRPNDRSYPQQEAGIGWFPTDKVRLFPNRRDIQFDYPVHEMVDATVKAAGITIRSCPIPIHHYGHLNETRNQHKAETYFKLGYAKLDQLGNDSVALRELAVQAGQLGRWGEAIDLWQRLLAVCPGYHEAFANLAGAHWQLGQYDQGIIFSKKAIQANPDIKEGHYNLAVNMIMKGQAEEAAEILQRLLKKHDRYLPARFMLAVAHCAAPDRKEGRQAFSALENEMSSQALSIAAKDLVKKLESSGRFDHANAVKASAGIS